MAQSQRKPSPTDPDEIKRVQNVHALLQQAAEQEVRAERFRWSRKRLTYILKRPAAAWAPLFALMAQPRAKAEAGKELPAPVKAMTFEDVLLFLLAYGRMLRRERLEANKIIRDVISGIHEHGELRLPEMQELDIPDWLRPEVVPEEAPVTVPTDMPEPAAEAPAMTEAEVEAVITAEPTEAQYHLALLALAALVMAIMVGGFATGYIAVAQIATTLVGGIALAVGPNHVLRAVGTTLQTILTVVNVGMVAAAILHVGAIALPVALGCTIASTGLMACLLLRG